MPKSNNKMESISFHRMNLAESFEESSDRIETTTINIDRIVIDRSGSIGSLYDAYEDNIKDKLDINFKCHSDESTQPIKCELIKTRKSKDLNLLKIVSIDHQLRLNILLNIVQATGIASLIKYSQSIDEHTRLLYLYQESLIESCRDSIHQIKNSIVSSTPDKCATHIITEIIRGIHLLIILQLPSDQESDIDIALLKLQHCLSTNDNTVEIDSNDRTLFDRITSTTVYSNISDLSQMIKLEDVYQRIKELQTEKRKHRPLKYILTPIEWFYDKHAAFIPYEQNEIESLEHYLLRQSSKLKRLELRLDQDWLKLLQGKLGKQLKDVWKDFSKLKQLYEEELQQIRHRLSNIRQGKVPLNSISSDLQTTIKQSIEHLSTSLNELEIKGEFIQKLQNKGFKYYNVVDLGIEQALDNQGVQDILVKTCSPNPIFCAADVFRNNHHKEWTKLYNEMIEQGKKEPQLTLVYADFTYSTYTLKKMAIIPPTESKANNGQPNSQPSEDNAKPKSPIPSSTDEIINILLLGESGVGKSTFINAFANYLYFENLNQAEHGDPIVIIPVTFLMTINDNFDEQVIKFGEADPNENHNNSGQSVTQQCKSYVFNISNEKKLRIIDTPGFGDTRGSDQDNLNMEEIFSFINNLPYLNGICLLFKPEVIQLNPYLRSCCTQLFDYFGENIRDYFIFCFTNTRSTFFAPGNTRPLLNTFFESFPVKNIPFNKRNTFCFDSESFRYLVAKNNSIKFNKSDKKEFQQSWLRSVTESKRFRDYLIEQVPYRRNNEWKSHKDARFQINFMVRPMLEAMRNLLRSIRLYNDHSSIKLHAALVQRSNIICYTCERTPERYGGFWILPDRLHNSRNKCISNEHKSTEYRLNYEHINEQTRESCADLATQVKALYRAGVLFSQFLAKTSESQQSDPFLDGIERMINEENFICQNQNPNDFNQDLVIQLEKLKKDYQKKANATELDRQNPILSSIYDLIQSTNEIPMVKVQVNAIRKYHQHLLESNQRIARVNESY